MLAHVLVWQETFVGEEILQPRRCLESEGRSFACVFADYVFERQAQRADEQDELGVVSARDGAQLWDNENGNEIMQTLTDARTLLHSFLKSVERFSADCLRSSHSRNSFIIPTNSGLSFNLLKISSGLRLLSTRSRRGAMPSQWLNTVKASVGTYWDILYSARSSSNAAKVDCFQDDGRLQKAPPPP